MSASAALGWPALLAAVVAWQLGGILVADRDDSASALHTVAGAIAVGLAVVLGLAVAPLEPELARQIRYVLIAAVAVLLTGLQRDLGRGRHGATFVMLLLGAAPVVGFGGVRIEVLKLPFVPNGLVDLGAAGPLLTWAWIVAVASLFRATDPLPGLTAGLGAVAAVTFALVAILRHDDPMATISGLATPLALILGLACAGFVAPGLKSGGVSLGRGGASFVGFLLAVVTVVGTLKHTAFLVLGLPLLTLAVPLLNVLYMQRQRRRAQGQDPSSLDRARTLADMLSRRGFTHRRSTGLLLGLQVYCCLVALALVGLITIPFALKLLLVLLLLPAAFIAFFLVTRIAARYAVIEGGRIDILGVPVDSITYDGVCTRVDEFIASGQAHHIVTADVSGIMRARSEPELRHVFQTADLVTADGAGVLWAARIFDFPLPERVSGVDLVRCLSGLAARQGYRVFLLGAAPGVADEAARVLTAENPGLTICGVQDGYYQDEDAVAEKLREAKPDILFVALGIPRQERFIRKWYQELGIPVSMGIGGSFDVISGKLQRAPEWMQRAGLEWIFRVIQQPSRIKRLGPLPKFVWAIGWSSLRMWVKGEQAGVR